MRSNYCFHRTSCDEILAVENMNKELIKKQGPSKTFTFGAKNIDFITG